MIIKSDKEFRQYQAALEVIYQRGFALGSMELLSEEDKNEYIRLSDAICEWEEAYYPLPGCKSTLCVDDEPTTIQNVHVSTADAVRSSVSFAL
jgi:hypothetical protein